MADIRDFSGVTSYEDLAELIEVDEVVKVLINREQSKVRNRAKNAEDRAILKFARDNPDQFEHLK